MCIPAVMKSLFIESFRAFVSSLGIEFLEDGVVFEFPKNNFAIILHLLDRHGQPNRESDASFEGKGQSGLDILHLYEDRWFYCREMMEKRILARLNTFRSIFARKCLVNYSYCDGSNAKADANSDGIIGKSDNSPVKKRGADPVKGKSIREFIEKYHPYGYAKSKFLLSLEYEGRIVAAAAFSAPRPMPRGRDELTESFRCTAGNTGSEKIIFDSYEWVRYISLPDVRVVGGMGKLLGAFLKSLEQMQGSNRSAFEAKPVEIMTYSDQEWSAGDAYTKLGFKEVACRDAVTYFIDKDSYERLSYRKLLTRLSRHYNSPVDEKLNIINENALQEIISRNYYIIQNRGSRKFLLQKRDEQ